jgi:nucleoid-associated protein YgaU
MKIMQILAVAALTVSLVGCASQKPKNEPKPEAANKKIVLPAMGSYVVKPGDSLWKIAGADGALTDSFRWPLLFRENRDQIEDPDFIYPKQDLRFKKQYTEQEIADAVKKAKDTPAYQPRTEPRKNLPVKY